MLPTLMQNLALVEKVDELARAKGVKPGQLALAWVHAQVRSSLPSSHIALHTTLISALCCCPFGYISFLTLTSTPSECYLSQFALVFCHYLFG